MTKRVNAASRIKRRRATRAEMEERAAFLIAYAEAHGPVTVRGLWYQAGVAKVPGIEDAERETLRQFLEGLADAEGEP